jgi:hypothetical protein
MKMVKGYTAKSKRKNVSKLKQKGVPPKVAKRWADRVARSAKKKAKKRRR